MFYQVLMRLDFLLLFIYIVCHIVQCAIITVKFLVIISSRYSI